MLTGPPPASAAGAGTCGCAAALTAAARSFNAAKGVLVDVAAVPSLRTSGAVAPSGLRPASVVTSSPPSYALGSSGRSLRPSASGWSRCSVRSCAKPVAKTSGAPLRGRIVRGCSRHATWRASCKRKGGGTAFWMAGNAMTMTDFGSWKDGATFRRRFRASPSGKAMAGMY